MMIMGLSGFGGFNGLGSGLGYDDSTPCQNIPNGDPYRTSGNFCSYNNSLYQFDDAGNITDANGNAITGSATSSGGGSSTTPTDSNSQPWWSTALTALVKGTAQGLVTPSGQPVVPVATATPWYKTTVGMVGIAGVVLGGVYLFLKK